MHDLKHVCQYHKVSKTSHKFVFQFVVVIQIKAQFGINQMILIMEIFKPN